MDFAIRLSGLAPSVKSRFQYVLSANPLRFGRTGPIVVDRVRGAIYPLGYSTEDAKARTILLNRRDCG
jgi:hypothetical protein